MNIWNKDCRILNESNYNMNYSFIPQQFDLKFIESNLNFLNNISSSQIIIDDYINQFKSDHIIYDCCNLANYEQKLLLILKNLNVYIKQYNKLKNQYIIVSQLINLLNKDKIINILSDYKQFELIVEYFELKTLPIQYIPYIIPHLNKFIIECPINNLNNHCYTLINICDNIYDHQKFELFDLIFTKDFNKAFMKRVIIILKNYELDEIQYFLFSTHIGTIITSWPALQALFDDYYNSQYLLKKL